MALPIRNDLDYQQIPRRTKIVSTLGPKCSDVETLKKMLVAGVNVFRLNFSFGDHDSMRALVANIQQASKETKIPYSTLGDLQGPKFRTGKIQGGAIQLENGSKIRMKYSKEEVGNAQTIVVPHQLIMKGVKDNERILLDDGTMELKVTKRISDTEIEVEVVNGGKLKEHKGINLPGLLIHFDDILEKDKRDALLLLELQVDFVGVSFVQTAEDLHRLRSFLKQHAKEDQRVPQLISKIEKPQALEDIDNIMQASDGIMVARGDLGVELSLELTPVVQKMLIRKANEAGKPVITATQMLSSMETAEAPTRAEVSDVSNAVFDGTDATMTSGETAMSSHPALVVETMSRILKTTEQSLLIRDHKEKKRVSGEMNENQLRIAVAVSALEAAADAKAKAIIVFSDSGEMAKLVSKGRPNCPIISFTPKRENREVVIHVLRLYYGIYPFELDFPKYIDTTLAKAENVILTSDLKVKSGDWVVMCAGNNLPIPGLNNMTKIFKLGEFLRTYVEHFHIAEHHHADHIKKP